MEKKTTRSGLSVTDFSAQIDGKETALYVLTNKNGLELTITNYGAKIVSLMVPDKQGKFIDVVTGHNSIAEYLTSEEPYFGAICGRYGNRIAGGKFTLDGIVYDRLPINNGPNCLHGGISGFNFKVWDATQTDAQHVELTYLSKDGEEGFPGNLHTTVSYHLSDSNEVIISYQAETDKPTVLNLTNHSYFNLSGAGDPYVGDHQLMINADYYLPTDNTAIPYGASEGVAGTPMDFRTPQAIGARIDDDFEQLVFGNGYDHTYILNKEGDALSFCAKCSSPKTGIVMEAYTTEPGVQLYTSNWTTGSFVAKQGKRYPKRCAFCLETQHFPDSPNKPEYPSTALRPNDVFRSKTIYRFSVE